MDDFFLAIAILLGFFVLLCLYRGVYGPTVLDRIVSIGVIGTKTTIILVFIGILYKRVDMFVDISLAYAMLNFIATMAAAKFIRAKKGVLPETSVSQEREVK